MNCEIYVDDQLKNEYFSLLSDNLQPKTDEEKQDLNSILGYIDEHFVSIVVDKISQNQPLGVLIYYPEKIK